jgi:hypothetical protein
MPDPNGHGYRATNDLELVVMVIRSALEPGYVVAGPAGRVLLRDDSRSGCVEPVPRYEADTVTQLLDHGHLRLGATEHVSDGHHEGPASAVLVPAATRALAVWWAARPLPGTQPVSRPHCAACGDAGRIRNCDYPTPGTDGRYRRRATSTACHRYQLATGARP